MTLEHATHTTYKITRFDSEEWLNYNKKERSKPLKNEPNCLKPVCERSSSAAVFLIFLGILRHASHLHGHSAFFYLRLDKLCG